MPRSPPRSTLFPYTTLFDLGDQQHLLRFNVSDADHGPVLQAGRERRDTDIIAIDVRQLREGGRQVVDGGVSRDRKSTRLNSSHRCISYAVFCLKKKKIKTSQ